MWVEPDTNMTSGESLVRQLLHGKRYFKEELGRGLRSCCGCRTPSATPPALPADPQGLRGAVPGDAEDLLVATTRATASPTTTSPGRARTAPRSIPSCPRATPTARTPGEISQAWKKRVQKRGLDDVPAALWLRRRRRRPLRGTTSNSPLRERGPGGAAPGDAWRRPWSSSSTTWRQRAAPKHTYDGRAVLLRAPGRLYHPGRGEARATASSELAAARGGAPGAPWPPCCGRSAATRSRRWTRPVEGAAAATSSTTSCPAPPSARCMKGARRPTQALRQEADGRGGRRAQAPW